MASFGLTANYITPYALTMQATTQQIGYLTSLPNFASMLIQLFAPLISERVGSRKSLLVWSVLVQALLWFPILLIPFVFHNNLIWWLVGFVTLSTAAGGLIGPPWSSMIADLAPPALRGRYFGLRTWITNLVALIFSFISAGLLQLLTGNTRLAFALIFAGAGISRMVSCYYVTQVAEPKPVLPVNIHRESILEIARGLWSTNIGRFIIFAFFMTLAQNIDAPFLLRLLAAGSQYQLHQLPGDQCHGIDRTNIRFGLVGKTRWYCRKSKNTTYHGIDDTICFISLAY